MESGHKLRAPAALDVLRASFVFCRKNSETLVGIKASFVEPGYKEDVPSALDTLLAMIHWRDVRCVVCRGSPPLSGYVVSNLSMLLTIRSCPWRWMGMCWLMLIGI